MRPEKTAPDPRLPPLSAEPLLEASPNAVVGVDATGTIIYANPNAERFFGWSAADLVGRRVEELLPDELHAIHLRERSAFLRAPVARPMGVGRDLVARRRDGSTFPAEISLVPVETTDGLIVFATVIDITARRSLETQLLEAQKLESVGMLAGGIAHDFNNVLTAVIGHADLLLADSTDPNVRAGLATIKAGAERAAGLTQQLLAFGRRQMLQPEAVDPNDVVLAAEAMLRPLLGEQIELVLSVTPGVGSVRVDVGQFEQVLLNLALNGRDAMPDGGTLAITTSRVLVEASDGKRDVPPGDYVVVAVSDTGVGMDEATKGHIFEPFFTTKGAGQGHGLGLATTHGVVRQSNGYLTVDSKRKTGSTFRVFLPRLEPAPTRPQTQQPAGSLETHRILLAEDEAMVRDLATRILQRAGHAVTVANDANAALRIASDGGSFDVLVSDIVMPQLSGVELARRLRKTRPSLGIVLMSGYAEDSAQLESIPSARFLAKPFAPEAMLRAVSDAAAAAPVQTGAREPQPRNAR